MYIYNPQDFDPLVFLPAALSGQGDAARALVHFVEAARADKRLTGEAFVPLKAAYLRNLVGAQHYLAIRTCLADAGVIQLDGRYVPGEKSIGYRIGPLFERSRFRRFLLTDRS